MNKDASKIAECTEIIEQVMEWLGCQWRISQIRAGLIKIMGGSAEEVSWDLTKKIIEFARKRIRVQLGLDADEYRGRSLEFYASVVRNDKAGLKYRLHAQTRIDRLLGLEAVVEADPNEFADKLRKAVQLVDGGIPSSETAIAPTEEAPKEEQAKDSTTDEDLISLFS